MQHSSKILSVLLSIGNFFKKKSPCGLHRKYGLRRTTVSVHSKFYDSSRYKNYWQLKGINNTIKIVVGKLEEWKEIKNSIISNGIILYGKYKSLPEDIESKVLYSWENVKPESRRVLLSKRLFGYKKGKKAYPGIVEKYGGERAGKGMIIAPNEHNNEFMKAFRELKIDVRIRKFIEYK